jgi:hypothetical protein
MNQILGEHGYGTVEKAKRAPIYSMRLGIICQVSERHIDLIVRHGMWLGSNNGEANHII